MGTNKHMRNKNIATAMGGMIMQHPRKKSCPLGNINFIK
jgi:hypothetical protein